MAQNFSKKENEYQNEIQIVTLKNYYDYSVSAESPAMRVDDLVKSDAEREQELSEAKNVEFNVPFVLSQRSAIGA